jgi:hypothetical protein
MCRFVYPIAWIWTGGEVEFIDDFKRSVAQQMAIDTIKQK